MLKKHELVSGSKNNEQSFVLFCFVLFGGRIGRRWRGLEPGKTNCDNKIRQVKERETVAVRKARAKRVYQVCF